MMIDCIIEKWPYFVALWCLIIVTWVFGFCAGRGRK